VRSPFSVRKLRVTENLDKLLEGGGHDDLVVVTVNNILENGGEECGSKPRHIDPPYEYSPRWPVNLLG